MRHHAALVASGAAFVQFKLFRTNGLLWSLAAGSLAVPLIDGLLPGGPYQWRRPGLAGNFKPATSTKKGTVYEPVLT